MNDLEFAIRVALSDYSASNHDVLKPFDIPWDYTVKGNSICRICGDPVRPGHVLCSEHSEEWSGGRRTIDFDLWVKQHKDSPNHTFARTLLEAVCPACETRFPSRPDYLCHECRYGC